MFTEEDGANISNDGANINNLLESSSREPLEKPSFLKIAVQAFETGDFQVFEAHFLVRLFLTKQCVAIRKKIILK